MLYAVAMTTGFRAQEMARPRPGSFDLDASPPTATVRAAYTKNRHVAVQPLLPDVAEALRGYLAGRSAGRPLWPGAWYKDAAEMLRLDTWPPPASPTATQRAGWPTSTRCDTRTSPSWSGAASALKVA